MPYSSIVKKRCRCGCGKYPSLSYGGWNFNCAPQEIKDRVGTKNKVAIKNRNARTKVRMLIDKAPTEQKNLQELWFGMVAEEIRKNPFCWNCGEKISESDFRNSSGHIFPKSIFNSVATHPLNFIVVGNRCGCHDDTHRIDKFSKMPVFKIAVERFRIFEPLITEKHKLLDLFKESIPMFHPQPVLRNT